MIKRAYLDVETTGTIPYLHGMYELAGVIDIDGEVEEEFCFLMYPFHDDEWDPGAEKVNGMNMEKLKCMDGVMSPEDAFRAFKKILLKYIDEKD